MTPGSKLRIAGFALALLLLTSIIWYLVFARQGATSDPGREIPSTASLPELPPASGRLARLDELSEAEVRYGIAPTPSDSVEYQPDVVIVQGGGNSIRMQGADGLSWVLDPSAPGATEVEAGKILLVTSRCVGRVLAARPTAQGLFVVLGPVTFHEVVRNANIQLDLEIDPGKGLFQVAPEMDFTSATASNSPNDAGRLLEWLVPSAVAAGDAAKDKLRAGSTPDPWDDPRNSPPPPPLPPLPRMPGAPGQPGATDAPGGAVAPGTPMPPPVLSSFTGSFVQDGYQVQPVFGPYGIGARVYKERDGVKFVASASLRLGVPRLRAGLTGSGAFLRLEGAAGVSADIGAGRDVGSRSNLDEELPLHADLRFPVVGTGVPLEVTVHQAFVIKTLMTAPGVIHAHGASSFTGALEFRFQDGRFDVLHPTSMSQDVNFLHNLAGPSIGVNGAILTHRATITVGFGAFSFSAGPYIGIASSAGLTNGSALNPQIICKGAVTDIDVLGGLGYSIPKVLTDIVNAVLDFFGVHARLKPRGGVDLFKNSVLHLEAYNWETQLCGDRPARAN